MVNFGNFGQTLLYLTVRYSKNVRFPTFLLSYTPAPLVKTQLNFFNLIFLQAIGATLLISAAPFFILFFIPLDNSQEKQWLLKEFVLSHALHTSLAMLRIRDPMPF
jgi:hypothetical protein